jgi:UDP-N-acetylglucosamine 3-dehydrogenase
MLKVGIIGAGAVVQGAHVKAFQGRKDVTVAGIADPRESCRALVGAAVGCDRLYEDYRRILDDPSIEALDICLPHFMHESVVLEALGAGKHVLLEKPIALTLDQADRMVAAAAKAGRQFYVALNERFYPAHRELKRIIDSGEHGRPFLALAQLVGDELARMGDPSSWKGDWDKAGGGALIDTGTHIMDLMLWWFGRPRTVACQWGRFVVEAGNKADDNVAVTLGWDGMLANIAVSYACASDPWREDKQVYFRDASVHVTMDPDAPIKLGKDRRPLRPVPTAPMASWWEDSVIAGVNHFLDCFLGKTSPAYGPEASRGALELILLAYRAAREQRTLTLET